MFFTPLPLSSETNTKIFKSEENGKNVVTSVLQFIGIKPSMMSGDTKAKQDARYFHKVLHVKNQLYFILKFKT